ncbi:MAG: hypothetical protein JWP60_2121 [Ramlibacter sp.]|nr:hypothetical protein [Ramlibacter sp.]
MHILAPQFASSLWWLPWATFGALGAARARRWLLQRRERSEASRQVLCIAWEVKRIAGVVDTELTRVAGDLRWRAYRARCCRLRQRADAALAHEDCVRHLSLIRLRRALNRFQRDAIELRRFRLELRTEIARWGYSRGNPQARSSGLPVRL